MTTLNKQTIETTIEALIAQRIRWEEGTYAASNTELYALLGQTLDFFLKVRSDVGLSKAVTELLDIYGITHNSSTSMALKVVRLVFVGKGREGATVNRAFVYTKVLEVAASEGITGSNLPAFIIERNGIDEIRRTSKDGVSEADRSKQNREYAETVLSDNRVSYMAIEMIDELQPADGEQFSVALIRKNTDGTGSIVFGTDNITAMRQVLLLAGTQLKKAATEQAEVSVSTRSEEQRQQNMARLANEMQGSFHPQAFVGTQQIVEPARN